MNITYCTRSTLRETYAAVSGLPGPYTPGEFDILHTRFSREWPDHQIATLRALIPAPTTLTSLDPTAELPPQWLGQMAWGGGQWIGRWGHRLVALHRVVLEGDRYQTFSRTMRPTLDAWLLAAREAYAFARLDPPVARVTFGYVNAFDLTPDASDLSEWFRFNFTIDAAGVQDGVSEIAIGARIPRPEQRARASVNLSAQQSDDAIRVSVHTVVERDVPDGTPFSAGDTLLAEIEHAKVIAKETFFSFVTDRTLERMGATDAEPEA